MRLDMGVDITVQDHCARVDHLWPRAGARQRPANLTLISRVMVIHVPRQAAAVQQRLCAKRTQRGWGGSSTCVYWLNCTLILGTPQVFATPFLSRHDTVYTLGQTGADEF